MDIINTFEKVNGVKVNYEIGPRRAGDLPEVWANVDKRCQGFALARWAWFCSYV